MGVTCTELRTTHLRANKACAVSPSIFTTGCGLQSRLIFDDQRANAIVALNSPLISRGRLTPHTSLQRRCFCFSCRSSSNDRLRFLSFLMLYSHRARKQVGS